jgi:hypothetical protein
LQTNACVLDLQSRLTNVQAIQTFNRGGSVAWIDVLTEGDTLQMLANL